MRVFLRFSVCDAPMGSAIQHAGPRIIRCQAASEDPFASLEIIRNGRVIRRLEPKKCILDLSFTDEGSGDSDYYYVRLTRVDGEITWSSLVWVKT